MRKNIESGDTKNDQTIGKISRRAFLGGTAALGGVLGLGAMTASAGTVNVPATTGTINDAAGFGLEAKRVDEPTYTKDIVGKIERIDERLSVWSQSYLVKGTPEYEEFYKEHPEWEKHNAKISKFWDPQYQLQRLGEDAPNFMMALGTFWGGESQGLKWQQDGQISPQQVKMDPAIAAEKIKGFAQFLGAPLVTIGPLKEEWLYTHRGYTHTHGLQDEYGAEMKETWKYAISIGVPQDYDMIATGTESGSVMATAEAYAQIALITNQIAAFIRFMGFRARASNFGNYHGMCVPIAIDSGMGELSRAGYLITKEFGTNLRLGQVFTDLPMALDQPVDLGVQDFCEKCKLCAEWCPSGAISDGEKVEVNGVKKWPADGFKCLEYWVERTKGSCGLCHVNCPWSKPPSWIHCFAVESATHSSIARSILPKAEKVVYGKWVNHADPAWITNCRSKR